jgi:hypothetical protein
VYFDHFDRVLGKPVAREVFAQDPRQPKIQVLGYDGIFGGCRAFCSLGLSRYAEDVGRVAEAFAPVDDGWDAVPRMLANALFAVVQSPTMQMGRGVAIGLAGISADFVRTYGKAALYFTVPFGVPPGFAEVSNDGDKGLVYLGAFITQQEYDYFADRGAESFEDMLEHKGADLFHLRRPSAI